MSDFSFWNRREPTVFGVLKIVHFLSIDKKRNVWVENIIRTQIFYEITVSGWFNALSSVFNVN